VDFLVPGLVGMNLMNAGMWGVGYVLVDMRIKRLLKRLLATPMRPADFMASVMTMRVLSTFLEVGFLLAFAALALAVPVRGSLAAVMAVALVGSLCFAGLGLAVACRARKIETASGLMNLVTLPMFVCSGVFFSVERFPQAVQPALRALPLTALNDALRAVTLEGAGFASQWPRLLVLVAWGVTSFVLGLRLFRWS
jgi:ABC-2 type transport system permease protein